MPPPAPWPRQLGAPASLGFCCSLWGGSKKRGSETCIKLFNLCKYHFLGDLLGGKKQHQCTRPKHGDVVSQCLCHLLLTTVLGSSHRQDSDVSALARQSKDRQKTFSVTGTAGQSNRGGVLGEGHTHTVALGKRKHSSMGQLCNH